MELVFKLSHQPIQMPEELCLVAFRNDMQFAYLFGNFVWSSYGTPWLEMAARGEMDQLSRAACQAFAQTVYGKHHRSRDIEVEGCVQYGHVVRALSLELDQLDRPGREALLVPIMILLLHAVALSQPSGLYLV
jgi:hypothetical protein